MLYNISNKIIKTYLNQRFKKIERIRYESPALQQKVLQNLISHTQNTEWGKLHQLNNLLGHKGLGGALPISTY